MPKSDQQPELTTSEAIRLDKWLWAARFFKTRSLASEAVSGGKVSLNGSRSQPGKRVRVGDTLRIRRGQEQFTVVVCALSDKRRGAPEAALLYTEDKASRQQRDLLRRQRSASHTAPPHRPSKQDRRRLSKIKRQLTE
jgi:ribosome-associated heat shock protein Hsp15